jgi:Cft2 family RNA processing exonuclease
LFISHAHYTHSRGFQFPTQKKYSTKETREIYEADSDRKTGDWQQVRLGRRVKVGEVELEAHDAGHVLGSVQYEVITPEGNVVYASHINFTDTLLTRAAEVAPCDTLVIEAAFAAPYQSIQSRESVMAEIVKWALECIKDRRIPALEADSIGNAQELVRIFNNWTELTVIVHPQVARINKVYENNGIALRYIDASTEEAQNLTADGRFAVVVPRRFDATRYGDFRIAVVSSWVPNVKTDDRKTFLLSDQADFNQLLSFVQEARPKDVLVFRGASRMFAQMVSKRLGIAARELVADIPRPKLTSPKPDEERVDRCQEVLVQLIQTPDFTYEKRDLMTLGIREGFKNSEIEEALARLTKGGLLKYSEMVDGYSLA